MMNANDGARTLESQSPDAETHALRFERREHDRWPVEGVATVFELGGEKFGRMHTLRMLDCGSDGLGALTDGPIEPGAVVSIGFQAPGLLSRRGTITRCMPCGSGYRVGLQFEGRLAA
jgi:hypothetical protein